FRAGPHDVCTGTTLEWIGFPPSLRYSESATSRGGPSERKGIANRKRRKPLGCVATKPMHGRLDHQRHSRRHWAVRIGSRERNLRPGARMAPGCNPCSVADAGRTGSTGESCRARVDLALAGATLRAVAPPQDQPEGKTFRAITGRAGHRHADSRRPRNLDASHGASQRPTAEYSNHDEGFVNGNLHE